MKKRILSFLLTLTMLLSVFSVLPAVATEYSGAIDISTVSADTGIASGSVYSISDQADLEKFAQLCTYKNSYFAGATVVLTKDIVLNNGWTASATAPTVDGAITWTPIDCFSGTFDGQNYKISGLYIPTGKNWKGVLKLNGTDIFNTNGTEEASGLFCTISGNVTIKNLKFENCYVNSAAMCGILAGSVNSAISGAATIENVTTATVTATSTNGPAGGIVGGQNLKLTIKNCTSASTVSVTASGKSAGGIIGQSWAVIYMDNCVNTGDVTATGYAGGMVSSVAYGDATKYIKGCTNYGKVSATSYAAGGILGCQNSTSLITVSDCENRGAISGDSMHGIGGIIGKSSYALSVSECNNYGAVSGSKNGHGGIVGRFDATSTVTVTDCTNEGAISGQSSCGGILGSCQSQSDDSTGATTKNAIVNISLCTNKGNVTTTAGPGGGIMGGFYQFGGTTTVDQCINYGTVSTGAKIGGGIMAQSNNLGTTNITNCKNAGQVTTTNALVGGILGEGIGKYTISGCENTVTGTVTAANIAGGILGKATAAPTSLTGCTNNGTVNGGSTYGVGGIIGYAAVDFTVEKCVNNGTVNNTSNGVGGIVGRNDKSLTVKECINAGTVKGPNSVGGIVGIEQSYTANASYKLVIDNCENSSTGNVIGGVGVGGIIGGQYSWTAATEIKNCINRGAVTTTNKDGIAGGIFGKMDKAAVTFTNCVNLGAVTYDRQAADEATASSTGTLGGIIGSAEQTFTITNSANFGAITFETGTATDGATSAIGGIVGKIKASGAITLTDCVSAGSLSAGNSAIGGIVGYQAAGTLTYTRCVFVGDIPEHANGYYTCGLVGRMDSTGTVFNECAYSKTDSLYAVGKWTNASGTAINVSGTVNGKSYSFESTTETVAWTNMVAINNALINAGVRLNLTDLNAIKNLSKFDWADKDNGWKLGSCNGKIIPMPAAVAKLVEEAKTEKANGVDFHGVQTKAVDTENTFDARFVSTVDDLNRDKIGVSVVIIKDDCTAGTYVLEDGKVYEALNYSINENTMGEPESGTYSVAGKYLGALVFEDISATGRTVFEVTAFSVNGDTKSYDDSYIVVFEDGAFAQSYQKNEQKSF